MADDRIRDASPDSARLPPDGAGAVERDGRWRPRPWTLGVLSVLFGASLGCLMIRSSAAAWASDRAAASRRAASAPSSKRVAGQSPHSLSRA